MGTEGILKSVLKVKSPPDLGKDALPDDDETAETDSEESAQADRCMPNQGLHPAP